MSSKNNSFLPWLYQSSIKEHFFDSPGLYGLNCNDPYIAKIISRYILKGNQYEVKTADEINLEWFEDTIGGYDLFSTENIYLIINGDDLKKIDYFLNEGIDWGNNKILLITNSEKKHFNNLAKIYPDTFLKVQSPKPWQASQLIEFFLGSMNLRLDRAIVNYLADALPFDSSVLMNAIKNLYLHSSPDNPLTLELAKELITADKIEVFSMADLWTSGKKNTFFQHLLPVPPVEDMLRLSHFMQSHFVKLIDPSYIDEKKSPSKYDQKIKADAHRQTPDDWASDMRIFARLEILCKQKSPQIEDFIKDQIQLNN